MFDIGFSEIVVIGVIALIVFGPEELPRVARLAGRMLGNFRRYVDQVKSELDQEIQASELKELGQEIKDSAQTLRSSLSEQMQAVESEVRNAGHEMACVAEDVAEPVRDAVAETGEAVKRKVDEASGSQVQQEPEGLVEKGNTAAAMPVPSHVEPALKESLEVPAADSGAAEVPAEKEDSQLDLFGLSEPAVLPHKS